ncbi:MAG: hypothetical protein HRT90_03260 [Candidatus Margulisbacteria bacterium]|nr:hypothetical protein [Candidatus Margulisiibacteriota bacterium]
MAFTAVRPRIIPPRLMEQKKEGRETIPKKCPLIIVSTNICPPLTPSTPPQNPIPEGLSVSTLVKCANQSTPPDSKFSGDSEDPFLSNVAELKRVLTALGKTTSKPDSSCDLLKSIIDTLAEMEKTLNINEDAITPEKVKEYINLIFNFFKSCCRSEPIKKAFVNIRDHCIDRLDQLEEKGNIVNHLLVLMKYYKLLCSVSVENRNESLLEYPFSELDLACVNGITSTLDNLIARYKSFTSRILSKLNEIHTQKLLPCVNDGNHRHIPACLYSMMGLKEVNDDLHRFPMSEIPLKIAWDVLFFNQMPDDLHLLLKKLHEACNEYDKKVNDLNKCLSMSKNNNVIGSENAALEAERNLKFYASQLDISDIELYKYTMEYDSDNDMTQNRAKINGRIIKNLLASTQDESPLQIPTLKDLFKRPKEECGKVALWYLSNDSSKNEAAIKILWLLSQNFQGLSTYMFLKICHKIETLLKKNQPPLKLEDTKTKLEATFKNTHISDKLKDVFTSFNDITLDTTDDLYLMIGDLDSPKLLNSLDKLGSYQMLKTMVLHGAPNSDINQMIKCCTELSRLDKDFAQTLSWIPLIGLALHPDIENLSKLLGKYIILELPLAETLKQIPETTLVKMFDFINRCTGVIEISDTLVIDYINKFVSLGYNKALDKIYPDTDEKKPKNLFTLLLWYFKNNNQLSAKDILERYINTYSNCQEVLIQMIQAHIDASHISLFFKNRSQLINKSVAFDRRLRVDIVSFFSHPQFKLLSETLPMNHILLTVQDDIEKGQILSILDRTKDHPPISVSVYNLLLKSPNHRATIYMWAINNDKKKLAEHMRNYYFQTKDECIKLLQQMMMDNMDPSASLEFAQSKIKFLRDITPQIALPFSSVINYSKRDALFKLVDIGFVRLSIPKLANQSDILSILDVARSNNSILPKKSLNRLLKHSRNNNFQIAVTRLAQLLLMSHYQTHQGEPKRKRRKKEPTLPVETKPIHKRQREESVSKSTPNTRQKTMHTAPEKTQMLRRNENMSSAMKMR